MNRNRIEPAALARLSATALTAGTIDSLSRERACILDFLLHLGEMDRRRLHLDLGYPSLFAYCTEALRLSEGAASRRITAARLLRDYPSAAPYLEDGRLGLGTFADLKEVLTPENHPDLLECASGKSRDQVKVLVRTLQPLPVVDDSIRRVPVRRTEDQRTEGSETLNQSPTERPAVPPFDPFTAASSTEWSPPDFTIPPPPPPRPRVEPIDAERYSVKFTVNREFIKQLDEVKSALSHVIPDGNLEAVISYCFEKTLDHCARRKHAALSPRANSTATAAVTETPARTATAAVTEAPARTATAAVPIRPRYPNAAARRRIWARDGGRCTFVGIDGRRCNSRYQLEFDHDEAWALGGASTEDNCFLRCKAHNQHRARKQFGEAHMAQFTRAGRAAQEALQLDPVGGWDPDPSS